MAATPPAPSTLALSQLNSSTTPPSPPSSSHPDQFGDPLVPILPTLLTPPPQSRPPSANTSSPPSPPSPPSPSSSSPPLASSSTPPPPNNVNSSPPAPSFNSPPASPPPPSLSGSPPPVVSPPSPPTGNSPPPVVSPSPPPTGSPPPSPVTSPPPPQAAPPSPSPPVDNTPPPQSSPPPPHHAKPPKGSHHPPPPSQSAPTPSASAIPPPALPSPPPSVPPSFFPLASSPPPANRSKGIGSPLTPSVPTKNTTPGTGNSTSNATGGLNSGGIVAVGSVAGFVVLSLIVIAAFFLRKRKRRETKPNLAYAEASPYGSSQNSGTYLLRPPARLKASGSVNNFIYMPSEHSGGFGNSFASLEQGGLGNSGLGNLYVQAGQGEFSYAASEHGGLGGSKSWLSYEELAQATDWFSAENVLGEGGFGKVYKGMLENGKKVAVKQLKSGGAQGEREFKAEVEIISRIHHRHLVSLVGYCISEHQRLLVYDYVPNNTLDYHIHCEGRPALEWAVRVKVAAGAARGIAYLHEDCIPRIIHRDIKSSNILLDENFEARVADFGLAKLAMELESQTHVSTRVMGTFGYMAPEYATSGKLTDKSDVFSFGVVLLEIITGKRPVDNSRPFGYESLVEWSRPLLAKALETQEFDGLVDPKLEDNYEKTDMFRMIETAAACVCHQAVRRPRMTQVVRALNSIVEDSDLSNGMKIGQSQVYDSAEQAAQIRMFQKLAFGSQIFSAEYSRQQ